MFSEKSRKHIVLPKVEGCIKLEIDTKLSTPREWSYTSLTSRKDLGPQTHGVTTITIPSGKRIQLYTPMQESKRAQRLKNIPYELQYFQTSLPTKNFKSSHLMTDELLQKPKDHIENMKKWQLRSHIGKSQHVHSMTKRYSKQVKQTESSEDINTIKKQNIENIEKEKHKRNQQYKEATQKLIDQFTQRFNIRALYEKGDLQFNKK